MALIRAVIYLTLMLTLCLSGAFAAAGLETVRVPVDSLAAPPNPKPGSCYGKHMTPAIIETVTEQILVQEEIIGYDPQTHKQEVLQPAIYRSVSVQKMVSDRHETWFETPCPPIFTENFVNSLQRALSARGYYPGKVSGWMDAKTKRAIRRYQKKTKELDSGILSTKTAQEFGLLPHDDFDP